MARVPPPQPLRDVELAQILKWSVERVRTRFTAARMLHRRHVYDWWAVRTLVSPRLLASSKDRIMAARTSSKEWLSGYPRIAAEWHPEKNGEVAPLEMRYRSSRRCWWRCSLGHEWQATVAARTLGKNCLRCRRLPPPSRSLERRYPKVANEWHPSANHPLTPREVSTQSHRVVWWKCSSCHHEWQAQVHNRTGNKSGCPSCAVKRVAAKRARPTSSNSLAHLAPAIAAEWDHAANGDLKPEQVKPGSSRRVGWRCARCAGTWSACIHDRTRRRSSGCPWCADARKSGPRAPRPGNSLARFAPEVARDWDQARNEGLRPDDISRGSKRIVWWRCVRGHEWQASILSRTAQRSGCPDCRQTHGRRPALERSLARRAPHIASEWDPERNADLTPVHVFAGSPRRAWWRCAQGHSWQSGIKTRVKGLGGCPECRRESLPKERSLAERAPEVALEWDAEKNAGRTPADVFFGSEQRAWWKCSKGHGWEATIHARTGAQATGCPRCRYERRNRNPKTGRFGPAKSSEPPVRGRARFAPSTA